MTSPAERYRPTVRELAEGLRIEHGGLAGHLVMRAYDCAALHHDGELRRSGDPYLSHPVAVALIVAETQSDPCLVAAAILHDVLDSGAHAGQLRMTFGNEVVDLIEAASELDRDPYPAPGLDGVDPRVVLLKLSDRLHNLRTIAALQRESQLHKARQTLEVHVPIAEHFGIPLGRQLHDIATDTLHGRRSAAPRSAPRHGGLSSGLISLAASVLPAEQRPRWRDEWRGELAAIPSGPRRLSFAVGVVLGTPALTAVSRSRGRSGGADARESGAWP